MNGFVSVAIDGPSGAGKSSLAKAASRRLTYLYVDTGAIYRCLGLACLRAGLDTHDAQSVMNLLPQLSIELKYNEAGEQRMLLGGEDVSEKIRQPEVSIAASDVSAIAEVRLFLLEMQRRLARENNVIMDGRDIGTVVLPQAEVKVFLTASAEARALRRLKQLEEKGVTTDFDAVLRDICYRDEQDSSRAAAPLKAAEDAVLLDTTRLDFDESLARLLAIIEERRG